MAQTFFTTAYNVGLEALEASSKFLTWFPPTYEVVNELSETGADLLDLGGNNIKKTTITGAGGIGPQDIEMTISKTVEAGADSVIFFTPKEIQPTFKAFRNVVLNLTIPPRLRS